MKCIPCGGATRRDSSGRSRVAAKTPPSRRLLDGEPLEAPWWMMSAAARGAAAQGSFLEGRASSTCCSSCAAPGSGRAPLRPRAGRVLTSTRDEGSACVAGRHGVLWLASVPCSGQEGTSKGLTTTAISSSSGPLQRGGGASAECSGAGRDAAALPAASGVPADVSNSTGRSLGSGEAGARTRVYVRMWICACVVCAFASVLRAACKSGMTTVLKTSSLLLSSRVPIDRVPLGSENVE